jgi:hypothetical protein
LAYISGIPKNLFEFFNGWNLQVSSQFGPMFSNEL